MRVLLKACFGRAVVNILAGAGHDVAYAPDLGLGRPSDPEVLQAALVADRVGVTLDDGFKQPEWADQPGVVSHPGIGMVRITNQNMQGYGTIVERLLVAVTDWALRDSVVAGRCDGYEHRRPSGTVGVPVALPPEAGGIAVITPT